MTFEVANNSEDEKSQSKDHQHGEHEKMSGPRTKTIKECRREETKDTVLPGQDIDSGIKPEQETWAKSQTSVEVTGGTDEICEEMERPEEEENYGRTCLTSKEPEEPSKEENHDDGVRREEATEGQSAPTERSPEARNSLAAASPSHKSEAHVDMIVSALGDAETAKEEAALCVLEEQFLHSSASALLIAGCELGPLASRCPSKDTNEQERGDEVPDTIARAIENHSAVSTVPP